MSLNSAASELVKDHFDKKMDARTRQLREDATFDLWHGPTGASEDYPGYLTALRDLEDWAHKNMSGVWVDMDAGEVLESEPDRGLDHVLEFSYMDAARAVFGRLIIDGGMDP